MAKNYFASRREQTVVVGEDEKATDFHVEIVLIMQMRKWRHKGAQTCSQGHGEGQCWSGDSDPGGVSAEAMLRRWVLRAASFSWHIPQDST